MSPEDLAILKTAADLVGQAGVWPLASAGLAVIIGPWIMSFVLARGQERRFEQSEKAQEQRFAAVRQMYEKNVALVEGYEKVCQLQARREEDLRSIIVMNTQAMTRLTDMIDALRN
ncbi:MAG: hypothetical protein AB1641_19740 [Thermodesulfobacteriota bacterium]